MLSPSLPLSLRPLHRPRHRDGHTLLLRAGTFYLPGPIEMTEADAHTVIQNYRGEDVSVSGGVLLSPRWRPHPTKPLAIVATLDLDAPLAEMGVDSLGEHP